MSAEIVPKEFQRAERVGDQLPPVGQWCRVICDPEKEGAEPRTLLMCVQHVASNHLHFSCHEGAQQWSEKIKFADLLARVEIVSEPEAKAIIADRLDDTRARMAAMTASLYEAGVKANAISEASGAVPADMSNGLLPAVQRADPLAQKRQLVELKERLPEVVKGMDKLAADYAGHAINFVLADRHRMGAVVKELAVLDDKIFTLEVYAGLQEIVMQIADGQPAKPDERIAIRQTMLFMDEETLIDFGAGGMDFAKLEDFDAWVVKPENLDRVLPEQRGVVSFRVRRHAKDYGKANSLWEAWAHARWNGENFKTYLLIRNGQRVYRIASSIDFGPRLIPYRDQFEGKFTVTHRRWAKDWPYGADELEEEEIRPDHFEYDKHVEALRKEVKHYARIAVLIQGLLDRSECFHPHPLINLGRQEDCDRWLNPVRDDEGALGLKCETWQEYVARLNSLIVPGSTVRVDHNAARWCPQRYLYGWRAMPEFIQVDKVRVGRASDVLPSRPSRSQYGDGFRGRDAEHTIGIAGIEVSWESNDCYPDRRKSEWLPVTEVFNMSGYTLGDFKKFLCDRTQKGAYLQWAPMLLTAETWRRELLTKRRTPWADGGNPKRFSWTCALCGRGANQKFNDTAICTRCEHLHGVKYIRERFPFNPHTSPYVVKSPAPVDEDSAVSVGDDGSGNSEGS